MSKREEKTRLSAIWAAYGDALGFVTELADRERVEYRTGSSSIMKTMPWRRKIGGKPGIFVDLPAGTYSDDTQLRLATSRSVRSDGSFDVAAFAKIELTAWANYALGAGVGSREAAANLARTSATWYSNFFDSKRASYSQSGGNGAAMRIQPHVWSASSFDDISTILANVVKNAICTHGHPRGILGACFHALTLAFAFKNNRPADLVDLHGMTDHLKLVHQVAEKDGDLRLFWLGPWQDMLGVNLLTAIDTVVEEIRNDVELLLELHVVDDPREDYRAGLEALGAFDAQSRGSGTKTAILAAFLAFLYKDDVSPEPALINAANTLGTDTDSIASMAGAILGACKGTDLKHALQDRGYIEREARRLALVGEQREKGSFGYPDLRSWRPERAAVDAIVQHDDLLVLNGIATAELLDDKPFRASDGTSLRWLRLSFGQTILARMRDVPNQVSRASDHIAPERQAGPRRTKENSLPPKLVDLFSKDDIRRTSRQDQDVNTETLNDVLQRIIDSGFDANLFGRALLAQAQSGRGDFVERGIALTANVLTAYEARARRKG